MKNQIILYSYEIEAVCSASKEIAEARKEYNYALCNCDEYKFIADKLNLNIDALLIFSIGVNYEDYDVIVLPDPIVPSKEIEVYWAEEEANAEFINEEYDDAYLWDEWEIYCQSRREGMA